MPAAIRSLDPGPLRIAILDADRGFVRVLVKRAEQLGWECLPLERPSQVEELAEMRVDALVVDPVLLGQGASSLLEHAGDALAGTGIVICTGRSTVAERVRGLRQGADDWITKACHPEEVLARLESIVRRKRGAVVHAGQEPLTAGELEIRSDRFQAFVADRSVDLTRREFEVLELLARAEGRVLEREEIYQAVWGYAMAHGDRSVDVFVRKVRRKLDKASPSWSYIHTHFGVGYRFQPERQSNSEQESEAPGPPAPRRMATGGRPRERHDRPAEDSANTTAGAQVDGWPLDVVELASP